MNSNILLLALKRMPLNSSTSIPVHIVLNKLHILINPKSIIYGSTSRYIVRTVTITERFMLSIRSIFYAVFISKDVPTCFGFFKITKCFVWTWWLNKLLLYWRLYLLWRYKYSTSFSVMGTLSKISFLPLRNLFLEAWSFSTELYLWRCYNNFNAIDNNIESW